MKKYSIPILLGMLIIMACSTPPSLSPLEYVRFCEDVTNGFHQVNNSPNVHIDVQYKPIPYVIANELRTTKIDKVTFKDLHDELAGLHYFTLKISIKEKNTGKLLDPGDISESYRELMSTYLRKDFSLEINSKEQDCFLYHYEPSHGIKPHGTLVLAFEGLDEKIDHFVLKVDNPSLSIPNQRFEFNPEIINHPPQLKTTDL